MSVLKREVVAEVRCRLLAAERLLADALTMRTFDPDLAIFGALALLVRAERFLDLLYADASKAA
jgi:hypothetical protein